MTLNEQILTIVKTLESQALISISDLRRIVDAPKAEFDAACLELQNAGKVTLHTHDYPAGCTPDARKALATDGTRYFVGIALRQNDAHAAPVKASGKASGKKHAGGRPLDGKAQKTALIGLRVTEKQAAQLRTKAAKAKTTIQKIIIAQLFD